MPIYEYRCKSCGKVFAKLQRVGASSSEVTCPECGSKDVERLLSVFASSGSGASASGGSCSGFT